VHDQILTQETDIYGGFVTSGSRHRKAGSHDTEQPRKDDSQISFSSRKDNG
jgi:hypothetical protein